MAVGLAYVDKNFFHLHRLDLACLSFFSPHLSDSRTTDH